MRFFRFRTNTATRLILTAAVTLIAGIFLNYASGQIVVGANPPDDLKLGVLYSCPEMSNYSFKVLSCDKTGWCQVFIVNEASPKGGNVTGQSKSSLLALIKKNECTSAGNGPEAEQNDTPPVKAPPKIDPNAETPVAAEAGSCPTDPKIAEPVKAGDSMELKSKKAILAHFQMAVDKGDKVAVALIFDNFTVGAPRTNIRGVNYYEDAAIGAKIYSIKSKFTVCSTFGTEITRDVTDGRYDCFQDKHGDWVCGAGEGYHIIKSTYEKRKK